MKDTRGPSGKTQRRELPIRVPKAILTTLPQDETMDPSFLIDPRISYDRRCPTISAIKLIDFRNIAIVVRL